MIYPLNRVMLALCVPLLLACPAFGQAAGDVAVAVEEAPPEGASVSALILDGDRVLTVDSEGLLDLGPSGTIEFRVAALWDEDPGYPPCVLASRRVAKSDEPSERKQATRYSIHITGDRSQIGMWNGSAWASAPFDFSDGQYHDVAFVTEGQETALVIDGEPLALLEVGYGEGTGLPFHIGSADGDSEFFAGALRSVRIWNEALPFELLQALAQFPGALPAVGGLDAFLLAHSSFSDEGHELILAEGTVVQGRSLKDRIRQAKAKKQAKKDEKTFKVDDIPDFDYGDDDAGAEVESDAAKQARIQRLTNPPPVDTETGDLPPRRRPGARPPPPNFPAPSPPTAGNASNANNANSANNGSPGLTQAQRRQRAGQSAQGPPRPTNAPPAVVTVQARRNNFRARVRDGFRRLLRRPPLSTYLPPQDPAELDPAARTRKKVTWNPNLVEVAEASENRRDSVPPSAAEMAQLLQDLSVTLPN